MPEKPYRSGSNAGYRDYSHEKHERHHSSSRRRDVNDNHHEHREKSRMGSISICSNRIQALQSPDTILTMAKELHAIRTSLQAWKRNRKAKLNGEGSDIVCVKLVDHHVENPLSSDHSLIPSYRNSPELNRVLGKLYQDHNQEKTREAK